MPTTHAGSIYDVEGPLDSVWGEGGEGVRWEGGGGFEGPADGE